ncbi:ferredoxin--NADP reductase [Haloplanus aerogenes]|uniref:FAD-dependent oxidoreductase n=1 Tax=Haloplanus aerogenes TaxID=660522 RepID=A0A3M0EAR6_9EURY|nr:FAD-dependent oxidoreductase [Haloplanus aerogenes]AZH25468.1 FAD-dependent oxidoreductase [Haloplanus aerogenes]RMB25180.1 ferredoxin-NADP reductase [Haloplanus aerogenes]
MPQVTVDAIEEVGTRTVALELETPEGFDAEPGQFLLVRATVDGVEETGYYTLSSPDVEGTMEVTVEYVPEGTLAPWLAEREPGDEIEIEGPFGDVRYTGDGDALVVAEGPGIGPAVGIAERAQREGYDATVVFWGEEPPHRTRLDALEDGGATVLLVGSLDEAADTLAAAGDATVYVFGFESFVRDAKTVADAVGVENVRAESFGAR